MSKENFTDNIVILRIFYETILNLLNNLEYPANLLLIILRADGNEILNKINEKFHIFYITHLQTDPDALESWNKYFTLYENICKILEKFKTMIHTEGLNLKFSQDTEVFILKTVIKYY